MANRLWDKGEALDAAMHRFTVGNDPVTDLKLVPWDVMASAAHARMLTSINILTQQECADLMRGLHQILELHRKGEFTIPQELEDCHTAIESYLAREIGEAGLKIHTGRSRNDQVLVAVRLFLRDALLTHLEQVLVAVQTLLDRQKEFSAHMMPGYTHFQAAMPTSVGIWLHAFAEALLDLANEGLSLLRRLNVNPLGVASGFNVPLPLNREMTAKLLAFAKVQRNSIDVANSRGRYELKAIRWASDVAAVVEKFACDFILFSTREFGFFTLPAAFTTGSSIMPQKRNPDVIELLRARTAKVRAAAYELEWVIGKLPSSYQRDHQYTKEPLFRADSDLGEIVPMFTAVIQAFDVNRTKLEQGLDAEVFATYEVYREVKKGLPFRQAYQAVAKRSKDQGWNIADLKKDFSEIAAINAQEVAIAREELAAAQTSVEELRSAFDKALKDVFAS